VKKVRFAIIERKGQSHGGLPHHWIDFEFTYLGKFEFKFKTALPFEPVDQERALVK
jgi:hypothetical protein